MQLEIDQIVVQDDLIEISYVVPDPWNRQSVIFKTSEFEEWLQSQRSVDLNRYWDHWQNHSRPTLEEKVIHGDIERFFIKKLNLSFLDKSEAQAKQIELLQDQLSLLQKKPMKRATGRKAGGGDHSKTA
ncbi:MAG: hypothetical protein ACR2MX_02120 [Cyclobacteriaceae bacterium]